MMKTKATEQKVLSEHTELLTSATTTVAAARLLFFSAFMPQPFVDHTKHGDAHLIRERLIKIQATMAQHEFVPTKFFPVVLRDAFRKGLRMR